MESLFLLAAIEKYEGKRKASMALSTSVDTINKYIENFEEELGSKLLSTSSRGSMLTSTGLKLIKKVNKIKEILDSIYSEVPTSDDVGGDVRVCTTLGINAYFMPNDLGAFFDEFPNIHLITGTFNKPSELKDVEYDIGITYDELPSNDVVLIHTTEVECGLFASSEYLAQYGYPKDVNDMLENYRIVNREGSQSYIKEWKEMIKRAKHICYTSNNNFSIVEVIKKGAGIGLIPMGFTKEGLVCLDNIKCDVKYKFYLFAKRASKDIPRVRNVIDYYRDLLNRM